MRARARRCAAALLAAAGLTSGLARADEPAEPAPVELDRLLKLPDSIQYTSERRGGATAEEWRRRFRVAHSDLATAQEALRQSLEKLDTAAQGGGGAWQVAPPGMPQAKTPEAAAPLDYQLSVDIRRNRAEVARAERALRELEVEADLAAVPEDWRK